MFCLALNEINAFNDVHALIAETLPLHMHALVRTCGVTVKKNMVSQWTLHMRTIAIAKTQKIH